MCEQVGDQVVVDGGMVSLEAIAKAGPDVRCRVVDPGIILSRANLTFHRGGAILRARNAMLPVLSSKVSSPHRCWPGIPAEHERGRCLRCAAVHARLQGPGH